MVAIRNYFAGTGIDDLIDIAIGYVTVLALFVAVFIGVFAYVQILNFVERRRNKDG